MRISDWSSDVCSSDLFFGNRHDLNVRCGIEIAAKSDVDRSRTKSFLLAILSHADEDDLRKRDLGTEAAQNHRHGLIDGRAKERDGEAADLAAVGRAAAFTSAARPLNDLAGLRSEEHTSELQSLMRISYAVFCLKKKRTTNTIIQPQHNTLI